MIKKEEERLFSSYTGHRSKTNLQTTHLSLYLHYFYTREKREEKPHLLAGFSPVLGFLGYILCLFVDGDFILLFSIFHILSISCIRRKISN
jgi:hypothetical protein